MPNYNLQAAHEGVDAFQQVPVLTLWDGLKSARLKLWDEDAQRLVTWAEVRPDRPAPAAPVAQASGRSGA